MISSNLFWKNKNVLVTGGAGFIGSHFVDALLEKGCEISILDNFLCGKIKNVSQKDKVKIIKKNIINIDKFPNILEGVDVVIHLAASASVPKSNLDPYFDFESNANATLKLLDVVRKYDYDPKIFYSSSALVHGTTDKDRIDEETYINPISFYGLSKYIGERYCLLFAKIYGFKVSIVRYFNVYGPRQSRYVAFDILKKLSKNKKELKLLGTGKEARDFLYVKDCVDASIKVIESTNNEVYNIGSGTKTTIKELVNQILKICRLESTKVNFSQESWKGDVKTNCADISKLKSLGFKPKYSLDVGLTNLIRWFEVEYEVRLIKK